MNIHNTTLLLIGYQNDYFSEEGVLRQVIDESIKVNNIVKSTIAMITALEARNKLPPIVATPIVFTEDYREIDPEPVGILKYIKALGAFRLGHRGSETIDELLAFGDRIHYLPGKHGFNAFSNTDLHPFLVGANTENIVIAGAVTSICIDSTARSAFDRGFKVHILSDCIAARTMLEHEFYCRHIFPMYAAVLTYKEFLKTLEPDCD